MEKQKETSLQERIQERGRDVWLAGLGALASDEGERTFERLVQRGRKHQELSRLLSERISQSCVPVRTLKRPEREGSVSRENIEQSLRAVHLSRENGEWMVRKTGAEKVRLTFPDEDEALAFAQSVAAKHEVGLFVHDEREWVAQGDGD